MCTRNVFRNISRYHQSLKILFIFGILWTLMLVNSRKNSNGHIANRYGDQHINAPQTQWLQQRKELLSKGGKKKVMLFCYMRGGSTFFSELFRQNDQVMYWYEPFDAFYSSVFGQKTWHFPQDIFWYQHSHGNSSLRIYSDWELDEMATFNHNLLACDFSKLPVESFYHMGMAMSNLLPFRKCLNKHIKDDPRSCRSSNIPMCSGNSKQVLDNKCPQKIKQALDSKHSSVSLSNDTTMQSFIRHAKCNEDFMKIKDKCLHILEEKCDTSKVITYKGLRVTMSSVEKMLQRDPDLHVIYFVRDPRGTVTSRVDISHTYRDTKNSVALEAKYHCAKLLADLKIYQRLIEEYPGAILLVKYEDVAQNKETEVRRIYNFYGMDVHKSVFEWMEKSENEKGDNRVFSTSRVNSTASIDKWRSKNPLDIQNQMTSHCAEVLTLLNYAF